MGELRALRFARRPRRVEDDRRVPGRGRRLIAGLGCRERADRVRLVAPDREDDLRIEGLRAVTARLFEERMNEEDPRARVLEEVGDLGAAASTLIGTTVAPA